MNLKVLLLLFPLFIFTQEDKLSERNIIDNYVNQTDSIANLFDGEWHSSKWTVSHSKQTEPQNPMYTYTQFAKFQDQVIRVCYRQKKKKKIEDWHLYFQNSKLVYVEIIKWHGKRNSTKKYYFEDEILFYPKGLDLEKEMDIIDRVKWISGK